VVSVFSQYSTSTGADFQDLGLATQSVNWIDGAPLVFVIPDNSPLLGQRVVDGVRAAVTSMPIDVSARLRDDPTDSVDTTVFVQRIEPDVVNLIEDPRYGTSCGFWLDLRDSDGDGSPDTFGSVPPGTTICFQILPESNVTVPSTGVAQEYPAFIDILGDGRTLLDTREIVFIVP